MSEDFFENMGVYLSSRRARAGLSQAQLADALQLAEELFVGVDAMTLSRWERGKVSPSIERQIALMEFFGDEPHLLLADSRFALGQLPSMKGFYRWMREQLSFNHVMGGHPYQAEGDRGFEKLVYREQDDQSLLELVGRYHANLTRQREQLCAARLRVLLQAGSSQAIFYRSGVQLVGHIVLLKLGRTAFDAVLRGDLPDSQLSPQHLADVREPGCLYPLSVYVGSQQVCEDALSHMFLLFMETPDCRALGFKARARFGDQLMEMLGVEVVGRGESLSGPRDGARLHGRYYEYLSCQVTREQLLKTPAFLGLVRQQEG